MNKSIDQVTNAIHDAQREQPIVDVKIGNYNMPIFESYINQPTIEEKPIVIPSGEPFVI